MEQTLHSECRNSLALQKITEKDKYKNGDENLPALRVSHHFPRQARNKGKLVVAS